MGRISALAVVCTLAATAPAQAQSWGFGVEFGAPVYYGAPVYVGPPPVYYEPPVIYQPAPPVYYEEAPIVRVPAPSRVLRMEAPEDVLAGLEAAGYEVRGPIDRRGALFFVTATAPNGDLVALEISIFSGEIERTHVLEARYAAAPPAPPAVPRPVPQPAVAPAPRAKPPAPKPTPAAAPAAPSAADDSGTGGSTMRDRLNTTPPAQSTPPAGERDPLVVY